ncbi:MAG: hypothetical protein Q8O05_01040 [Chloroflexota bacterium]|nr:hypothetical protein [Chloroflexota bacterium]
MTPEEEIKQLAKQRGAELVGIAAVADINRYAPPGYRPDDILPGAKSVVVFAGNITTRGAWRSPYYETIFANFDFFRIRYGISLAVAKFIESKYGYYALADTPPPVGLCPSLSLKLCAEMAGLGTRSMAGGVILNRERGVLNLMACVTTMPLKADGPLMEPVCPHASCVKLGQKRGTVPCLEACPECLSGELESGRIKWMRFDRRVCSTRAQNLSPVPLQRMLLEAEKEPDAGVRKSMLLGSFSRNALQAMASSTIVGQCGVCLRDCPVCIKGRTLKPREIKKERC